MAGYRALLMGWRTRCALQSDSWFGVVAELLVVEVAGMGGEARNWHYPLGLAHSGMF